MGWLIVILCVVAFAVIWEKSRNERLKELMWNYLQYNNENAKKELLNAVGDNFAQLKKEVIEEKAQAGDGDAQYMLGDSYYYDDNLRDAEAWYKRAALNGNVHAMHKLAEGYEIGYFTKNNEECFRWSLAASKKGYYDEMFRTAQMLQYGIGVTEDLDAAILWYQKACENPERSQYYSLARLSLGLLYGDTKLACFGIEKGKIQYNELLRYMSQASREKNENRYAHAARALGILSGAPWIRKSTFVPELHDKERAAYCLCLAYTAYSMTDNNALMQSLIGNELNDLGFNTGTNTFLLWAEDGRNLRVNILPL